MGMGGQRHAPAAFTPVKDPLLIVQDAGWAAGPVWIGVENPDPQRKCKKSTKIDFLSSQAFVAPRKNFVHLNFVQSGCVSFSKKGKCDICGN
jgi:hypothetical protein